MYNNAYLVLPQTTIDRKLGSKYLLLISSLQQAFNATIILRQGILNSKFPQMEHNGFHSLTSRKRGVDKNIIPITAFEI